MKRLLWLLVGGAVGAGGYWLARYLRPEQSTLVLNKAVVVITGASSGIGRALAVSFARRGCRVVLAARRAEQLEEVRAEITAYAADVLVVPTDVTNDAHLEALVKMTLEKYGQIDILVNNAGVYDYGLLQEMTASALRQMAGVNLGATMVLTRLVLPHMLRQRRGYIVNMASISGRAPNQIAPAYAATKAGVIAFSDGLRRQVAGTGVKVVSLLPVFTASEMVSSGHADLMRELGFSIDTVDFVAERTLDGILKGQNDIIFGGAFERTAVFAERHMPSVFSAALQMLIAPQFYAKLSKLHQQERQHDAKY